MKILPSGFGGQLEDADEKKRVYNLTQGAFDGGQLIVESTDKGLTGTFTLFGSGVPVISSSIGEIKPNEPDAEKADTGKPATAPESKPEQKDKH